MKNTFTMLLLAATALVSGSAAASIRIDVSRNRVTIANLVPGGTAVLLHCARIPHGGRTLVTHKAHMLRDDDRNGIVEFAPQGGVPMHSAWVAVDLATGAAAPGAPAGFPLATFPIAESGLRKDAEGGIARLEQEIRRLVLLVVRPGVGAWILFAVDGKQGDADRAANARLALDIDSAVAVERGSAAPKHLKHDDVLVAIDLAHLDVHLTRIGK